MNLKTFYYITIFVVTFCFRQRDWEDCYTIISWYDGDGWNIFVFTQEMLFYIEGVESLTMGFILTYINYTASTFWTMINQIVYIGGILESSNWQVAFIIFYFNNNKEHLQLHFLCSLMQRDRV